MKTMTISIKGMQNSEDLKLAKEALNNVWGVDQVEVSLERSEARLTYDEAAASDIDFEQALVDEGFHIGGGDLRA